MTTTDVKAQLTTFLEDVTKAMGVPLIAVVSEDEDGYRKIPLGV